MSTKVSLIDEVPANYGTVTAGDRTSINRDGSLGSGELAVSFHDVEYVISSCFGKKRKTILKGVR